MRGQYPTYAPPAHHEDQASAPHGDLVPAPRQEVERYDIARHMRIVRHRRTRALPWKIGGTTTAAGYAGWGLGELASALSSPLAHLAISGGTGLTALAALAVLRYRNRDLLKDTDTTWYRRAGAGSAAWAAGSAALGPLYGLGALALAGWVRVTAQPWLRPQLPDGWPEPEPHPDVELPSRYPTEGLAEESEGDRIRRTLLGSVLEGHELWAQEQLNRGWRWRVQLAEGVTYSAIRGCQEAIARPLHTARNRILIEPVPDNVGQAILTVITVDLLAQGVPYNGPEYHDGRIPIGLNADGETRTDLIAASKAGVHCSAFTGGQREGKSNAFSIGLLGMLESGVWITLFGDGDTGSGSNPVFAAEADWPTGDFEQVLLQLLALEALVEARQAVRGTLTQDPETGLLVERRHDQPAVGKILPSLQWPGYGWWLDEFHKFAKDEEGFFASRGINFPDRVETLIRVGAKYGVAVHVATHSLLRADWGTTTLLAALSSVNHVAFRFGSGAGRGQSVTIDGEAYSLDELPHEGYYLAPGAGGRGAVLGRAFYPADRQGHEFARPEMNEVDRIAVAPFWPKERRDAVLAYNEDLQRAAEWRERAEAIARGEDPDAEQAVEEDYSGYGDTVVQFRPTATASVLEVPEDLNPTRAAIGAALRDLGTASNRELHRKVPGISPSSMTKHLDYLADLGIARKPRHGTWEWAGTRQRGVGS